MIITALDNLDLDAAFVVDNERNILDVCIPIIGSTEEDLQWFCYMYIPEFTAECFAKESSGDVIEAYTYDTYFTDDDLQKLKIELQLRLGI